jgi:predicted Holliday junction resolvase-like endonuclease
MQNDTLSLLVVFILLIAIIYVFIRIAINLRKYGGSLTTTMFASTYEFLNEDKREAVEEVVEMKANKKLEEESSGKPMDD